MRGGTYRNVTRRCPKCGDLWHGEKRHDEIEEIRALIYGNRSKPDGPHLRFEEGEQQ